MEEVDKIIIHSLQQIGCSIEDSAFSLTSFTPELLVKAVSTCLHEINPKAAQSLPRLLPPGMAQRFTVATSLAEQCTAYGYRSDIGYQTFLYPNAVDVRRLLMFLIEQLPKENRALPDLGGSQSPIGEYESLRERIKEQMLQQLQAPWVPQYGRAVGNRRDTGCSSQSVKFAPQPNLNIPSAVETQAKEVQIYLAQKSPNLFQQTAVKDFDLISSVLHKNALDLYTDAESTAAVKYALRGSTGTVTAAVSKKPETPVTAVTDVKQAEKLEVLSPLDKLNESVNTLKTQYDALLAERKATSALINSIKSQQTELQADMEQLRKSAKLHERTYVVLQSPQENVAKLEGLIQTAQERRKTLEQQWQAYREPIMTQLQAQQTTKQARSNQSVVELRTVIAQLESELLDKTARHTQLGSELKSAALNAASRKEYTRRILEFIGNIRKQRSDIYKVLDDTRDLQKQLNSVSAQLQRQFNYTDDLLFQSAKHDLHAKKAYKLLASLHAVCNELVELVSQIGHVTKEARDLEVQIDREKLKHIAVSLAQITADIRNFENVIKNIQAEIGRVENEITSAG